MKLQEGPGLLFLALGMLLGVQAQCSDEKCEVAARSTGDEAAEVHDDVTQDMHMELLQRDLKLSDRDKLQEKTRAEVTVKHGMAASAESECQKVEIEPFSPCLSEGPKRFQVTSKNYEVANFSQWDEKAKTWKTLFQLDASVTVKATGKKFRNINSCAINPKNESEPFLYCSMQHDDGSFLVRIGREAKQPPPGAFGLANALTVGFLAKLRQWRWAAAFDLEDNYYVYGEEDPELGTLNKVPGVSTMPAFASFRCDGVQKNKFDDYEMTEKVKVKGKSELQQKIHLGADLAFFAASDGQKYLAALAGTDMKLLKIGNPYELIVVETENLPQFPMPMHPYKRVWGTAWSHNNTLLFSGDDGAGVYGLWPNQNLDIASGKAKFVPFGKAPATDWNDGFSCGCECASCTPPPCIEPNSGCTEGLMYRSETTKRLPLSKDTTSAIFIVNETTGKRKETGGWKVADTGLAGINACAMNPTDDYIYCILRFTSPDRNFIARLGPDGGIEYVMRVEGGWAYSGVFTDDGTFYYYEQEFGLHRVKNLNVTGPSSSQPHMDIWPESLRVKDFSQEDYLFKWKVGADFVILKHDGDVFLASIMATSWITEPEKKLPTQRLSLINITGGKVTKFESCGEEGEDPDGAVIYLKEDGKVLPEPLDTELVVKAGINPDEITYGSAWKSVGKKKQEKEILFADDSGQGVWKLLPSSVGVKCGNRTVAFQKKMPGSIVEWNDGFVCDPDVNKEPKHVKKKTGLIPE